jgi:hypothetical protein
LLPKDSRLPRPYVTLKDSDNQVATPKRTPTPPPAILSGGSPLRNYRAIPSGSRGTGKRITQAC